MSRSVLKKIPLRADPFGRLGPNAHRVILTLFFLAWAVVVIRLFDPSLFGEARWPEGVLLVVATASIVSSAVQQLPLQNVMLAGTIIAFIGGLAHTVGALTAVPFGPFSYTNQMPLLFPGLPWAIPVLWLLMILMCRGVGRLILRPWRKTRNYGFWLMGITTGAVVLFDFGLEAFATQIRGYWFWMPTHAFLYWHRTPWVNFFAWAVVTLVILGFSTPSLINKKPVKRPPEYWPLILWCALNAVFVIAFTTHQMWLGTAVVGAFAIIAAVFAIKGARW
jgi:hypothetical protein